MREPAILFEPYVFVLIRERCENPLLLRGIMGLQNWFSRVLMSTWFREISIIDIENLPSDRGSIIVSWHPGGLFDNMLTRGLLPGKQVTFDGVIDDEDELFAIATEVASGANVVVFPEGDSHDSPKSKQIRECAAKIALKSKELSSGVEPVIIPVGIHYSRPFYFRERVALTIDRPIEIKGSVDEMTEVISGEISRSSLSRDDWRDRELIWKARSIIRAGRVRNNPELKKRPTYGEDVVGARRVRAAWEWMANEDPERCKNIEQRTRNHISKLNTYDLQPRHVDGRPNSVSKKGFVKSICQWLFAWSFMVGFVTLSALIGSIPPFLLVVSIDRFFGSRLEQSYRGSLKLYSSFVIYPIWWLISAWMFTWALLSDSSPVAGLSDYSTIIAFLLSIPAALILPLMIWWMPTAGKLQMKLYARGTIAWRRMRLWVKWRDSSFDWEGLSKVQRELASDLVGVGDGLILPGDKEWIDPEPGKDDFTVVRKRN